MVGAVYRPLPEMQTREPLIRISVRQQRLDLVDDDGVLASYPISTSRFGLGSEEGSLKTPLGRFKIGEKIGDGVPSGTIFRSRIPLASDDPPPPTDDLVLTRILWLDGLEEHNANTRDRFIYIHGTNHEEVIGQPASHGCIRMKNADLIALFDRIPVGAEVVIES
jgi:lipoprotein-anchoring transpeptidase ErfK/SrfK